MVSGLLMPSLRRHEGHQPEFPDTIVTRGEPAVPWPKPLADYTMANWKRAELPLPLFEGKMQDLKYVNFECLKVKSSFPGLKETMSSLMAHV